MKAKKCKSCRIEFVPSRPLQSACGVPCAIALTNAGKEKARKAKEAVERQAHRVAKEKVKPRSKWLQEAQAAINRYVRFRDNRLGCVSCDKPATWGGQWHCSHFRSVGAAPQLRFNLNNMHKSCSVCNNHLSGNIMNYKPELVRRIGSEKVDWLESYQGGARYEIEYLKRLKAIFTRKSARLERRIHEM